MLTVLVTGGCGYVGAQVVYELAQKGYRVVVLDRQVCQMIRHERIHYVQCDLARQDLVGTVCATYRVGAVVHLAAASIAPHSVSDPYYYYQQNLVITLGLLDIMRTQHITQLVFASSAAVYRGTGSGILHESDAGNPSTPYGQTKWMTEQILRDAYSAYELSSISLRLFNVAGASPELGLWECHEPETHLIPRIAQVAASGQPFKIFGTHYDTVDGTAVRDYIHVRDVARAVSASVQAVQQTPGARVYNIGSGTGTSVAQMVSACSTHWGYTIPVVYEAARAGDPPQLVAHIGAARDQLGWQPHESSIAQIVIDAGYRVPRALMRVQEAHR